jgi:AGZA family xanthine/uracil permease-like MFS transporter
MIFAALIAFMVSREYMKAALVGFVAAVLAFFGIIHAPSMAINAAPALSLMWLLVGVAFLAVHFFHSEVTDPEEDTQTSEPQPISGSTPAA